MKHEPGCGDTSELTSYPAHKYVRLSQPPKSDRVTALRTDLIESHDLGRWFRLFRGPTWRSASFHAKRSSTTTFRRSPKSCSAVRACSRGCSGLSGRCGTKLTRLRRWSTSAIS